MHTRSSMWTRAAACGVLAAFCSGAYAQGAIDFSRIPGISAQPSVEVNLNQVMLGFVAEATRANDPEVADALRAIRGIRVLVYELDAAQEPFSEALMSFVDDTSGRLEQDGWQRIVSVQDDTDRVRIYMNLDDTQMHGLAVMVVSSDGDAVFVNIDGTIDPAMLGRLTGSLGMDGIMESLPGLGSGQESGAASDQTPDAGADSTQ